MQRLDLNLASNPFRNNVLLWLSYGTATLLVLTFTVWNTLTYVDYAGRLAELRDTVGNFENRRVDLETRERRALRGIDSIDIEALELQAAKANHVIARKAFSWTRLFNSLESLQPYQVRMNGVRPIFGDTELGESADEGEVGMMSVAIEGTARDIYVFTELEQALQEDPQFGRVLPQRLNRTDTGEILFQLRFLYYPEAAPGTAVAVESQPEQENPDEGSDESSAVSEEQGGIVEQQVDDTADVVDAVDGPTAEPEDRPAGEPSTVEDRPQPPDPVAREDDR
jgi:hypothetical protein